MMIVVFAENINGTFKKSTLEAVSYAANLAQSNSTSCVAVVLGNTDDSKNAELGKYGADKVVSIKSDKLNEFRAESYATAIASVASQQNATIIVLSNTSSGKSISGRIAAKLNAGVVSGVVSLPNTSNGFVVRKTVFSGKAFADVNITTPIKILAITPNTFDVKEFGKTASVENVEVTFNEKDFATTIENVSRVTGKISLTEAELVVSGGRGMKGPENWGIIEELASVLGAATACSKPVSDMDWRPHSEHVGQTGITIKPNLYIAIGISGAIQHLAGVSSSKVIVAINKDPEAPFFKAADYGIVGDAFDVLPKILEAAKKLKSATA
ncbi:MAG: electron transfer flavoprotein subunit alpha/FixB family protein [Bacteroidia bacterium]|nr:electron transfer flavoprotein subunit alpha/FixB family protein [Bacteroidia bacterium]